MSSAQPPKNPVGAFEPEATFNESTKQGCIETIRQAPAELRTAVAGLTDMQLDTRYKNWTVRQITHHIADSHLHSVIRFKWALTEDRPTIKASRSFRMRGPSIAKWRGRWPRAAPT